jgi:hypothetical protein
MALAFKSGCIGIYRAGQSAGGIDYPVTRKDYRYRVLGQGGSKF